MFGLNFSISSRDVKESVFVPVAIVSTLMLGKVAYNYFKEDRELPSKGELTKMAKTVAVLGTGGAVVGVTAAALNGQNLGKEGVKGFGSVAATILAATFLDSDKKGN